jgi:hypothetical protein
LSRLTTPENGFDNNKVSYSEYCRAQYDHAGNAFGTACTELARNRKAVRVRHGQRRGRGRRNCGCTPRRARAAVPCASAQRGA